MAYRDTAQSATQGTAWSNKAATSHQRAQSCPIRVQPPEIHSDSEALVALTMAMLIVILGVALRSMAYQSAHKWLRQRSFDRIIALRAQATRAFATALALTLGACSIFPGYKAPTLDIPPTWRDEQAQSPTWPTKDWWQGFGSPELDSLIAQAESGNLDLAAAVARVREADAQTRIAGAALLPAIDLGGAASRIRQPSISTLGTGASGKTYTLYDAQISASYEIDFWGKNKAFLEAAKATAQASRYSEATIALSTVTSVAIAYFQILELRDQIAVTEAQLGAAESILKALEAQEAAGTVTALDVALQETTVATLQAEIPPLQQMLRQFIDALAILVGKPPESVDINSGTLDSSRVVRTSRWPRRS